MNLTIRIALSLVLVLFLQACGGRRAQREPIQLRCQVPSFSPHAETKEFQQAGGIQISLAPVGYGCILDSIVEFRETPTLFSDIGGPTLKGPRGGRPIRVLEQITRPVLVSVPNQLAFSVRIHNKMERVFRGSGIVVQYIVAGKQQAIDKTMYEDLVHMIIPPRDEASVVIHGPAIETLPREATVGVFFFDVVSKTDVAGVVTRKHNFEWYYRYDTEIREDTGFVDIVRGWETIPRR